MQYILWGFTEETKKIADGLHDLIGFADNSIEKVGLTYNEKEVFSPQKVKRLYESGSVKIIIPDCIRYSSQMSIQLQLQDMGIKDMLFLKNGKFVECKNNAESNTGEAINIAVWKSYGNYYKDFIEYLKMNFTNIKVQYILTDNITQIGLNWNGIPFLYISKAKERLGEGADNFSKILIVDETDLLAMGNIVNELKSYGMEEIIYKVPYGFSMREEHTLHDILVPYDDRKEIMELQYMVAYQCNLNCKGCSHFSPLVKEPLFATADMIKRDLTQLKKLVKNIWRICMLGGEPLLNKQLGEILYVVREIYPNVKLSILTNGLLIRNMPDELVTAIYKTNTKIILTQYPQMGDLYIKDIEFLKKNNIPFGINMGKQKQAFLKRLTSKDNTDVYVKFENCVSKRCTTMFNGKIAACYLPLTISYLDKYFGTHLENEEDMLDIYEEGISGRDIICFLDNPNSVCQICNSNHGLYYWEQSQKEIPLSDYVINDEFVHID